MSLKRKQNFSPPSQAPNPKLPKPNSNMQESGSQIEESRPQTSRLAPGLVTESNDLLNISGGSDAADGFSGFPPVGDVSSCGLCNQPTGEDAIGCDQCSNWFHPKTSCTGLSTNAILIIQTEGGEHINYVCSACRCKKKKSNVTEN